MEHSIGLISVEGVQKTNEACLEANNKDHVTENNDRQAIMTDNE